MKKVDFIIVGQGLAGTLLAHFLLKNGKSIHLFDPEHLGGSSKVAAGIINPVTGRRVVKSWMIDELIPFAKKTYEEIEQVLGIKIFYQRNIVRALFSVADENLWSEKTADPSVEKYVRIPEDLSFLEGKIQAVRGYGEIQESAQVDMPMLLNSYRTYFLEKGMLTSEKVDYQQVRVGKNNVSYKNITASQIIFCEGQQGRVNPFFEKLPFEVAKGEVLLVKIPKANFSKIFKHKLFFVPMGEDVYWVGSTYDWGSSNDLPTEKAKLMLIQKLEKILMIPFEVLEHRAAIRPTTLNRRPIVGLHPVNKMLGVFNGLGTKGASLGPFFASQFVDFLLKKGRLTDEVNITREKPA